MRYSFVLQTRLQRPLVAQAAAADSVISFIGRFFNGIPTGDFWVRMIGDWYVHGKFDSKGEASGDSMAYIYPDLDTGTFYWLKTILSNSETRLVYF